MGQRNYKSHISTLALGLTIGLLILTLPLWLAAPESIASAKISGTPHIARTPPSSVRGTPHPTATPRPKRTRATQTSAVVKHRATATRTPLPVAPYAPPTTASPPTLVLTPDSGPPGTVVSLSGTGYEPGE